MMDEQEKIEVIKQIALQDFGKEFTDEEARAAMPHIDRISDDAPRDWPVRRVLSVGIKKAIVAAMFIYIGKPPEGE